MKVVLIAGGRGALSLHTALQDVLPYASVKIIVNAYDDGLSTGIIRKAVNCLGPSDVRKNHVRFHTLKYGTTPLASLIEARVEFTTWKQVVSCAREGLFSISELDVTDMKILSHALDAIAELPDPMFPQPQEMCIGNLFYAGLTMLNDFVSSVTIMEKLLKLPEDCVILNSCSNIRLEALLSDGDILSSEESIVNHQDAKNPIRRLMFKNFADNEIAVPSVTAEAKASLEACDLCIVAPGTQYSSIIPTIATEGLQLPKGRTYMVMNAASDGGQRGLSSRDITSIWKKYVTLENTVVCFPAFPVELTRPLNYMFPSLTLHSVYDGKHFGRACVSQILRHYYSRSLGCHWPHATHRVVIDWDETTWSCGKIECSRANVAALNELEADVVILTGNTSKPEHALSRSRVDLLYGMSATHVHIDEKSLALICNALNTARLPYVVYSDRLIRIKPCPEPREDIVRLLERTVPENAAYFSIVGRTTVDVTAKSLPKKERLGQLGPCTYLAVEESTYDVSNIHQVFAHDVEDVNTHLMMLHNLEKTKATGVVLAGGSSSRMGRPKFACQLLNQRSVLEDLVYRMLEHRCDTVYVGVAHAQRELATTLIRRLDIQMQRRVRVVSFSPTEGNATSFRALLEYMEPCSAIILAWADVVIFDSGVLDLHENTDCDAMMPCEYVQNPYVHVEVDATLRIRTCYPRKDVESLDFAWHDLGVFYLGPKAIKKAAEMDICGAFSEPSLLALLEHQDLCVRVMPMQEGTTMSFNTPTEWDAALHRLHDSK